MTKVFVTVGAQMPFDRLIKTVDRWAASADGKQILAQTGERGTPPSHMRFEPILAPDRFHDEFQAADVVVSHAGMGTILTALQFGKPLLVLPRRYALGETRNDHQVHTAEHFAAKEYITAAMTEEELLEQLERLEQLEPPPLRIGDRASDELITGLSAWFRENAPR